MDAPLCGEIVISAKAFQLVAAKAAVTALNAAIIIVAEQMTNPQAVEEALAGETRLRASEAAASARAAAQEAWRRAEAERDLAAFEVLCGGDGAAIVARAANGDQSPGAAGVAAWLRRERERLAAAGATRAGERAAAACARGEAVAVAEFDPLQQV